MKRRPPVGSSLRRRLPIWTSTTLVCAMNLKFHTSSSSIARVTIWPGGHEIFEEGELARQQIDQPAVALHGPLDKVHFERADLQPRLPLVAAPPQERFDPRRQLADVERLDQVVIAAGLQPVDALIDRRQRADHQGGRNVAFAAQRFDDRKSVLAMQHPVDHQDGGVRARRPRARRPQSRKGAPDSRLPRVRGESPPQARARLRLPESETPPGRRPSIE